MRIIVDIPKARDRRMKSWRRVVTGVDRNKTNGYAFDGPWLPAGRKAELEIGSLVLVYDEEGSRKYHAPTVYVHRVGPDGLGEPVLEADGWSWALELRDQIAELLECPDEGNRAEKLRAEIQALEQRLETLRTELAALEKE